MPGSGHFVDGGKYESGEISNMFNFSHGLNRQQPTLTEKNWKRTYSGGEGKHPVVLVTRWNLNIY